MPEKQVLSFQAAARFEKLGDENSDQAQGRKHQLL
jgi:hypothetical protein